MGLTFSKRKTSYDVFLSFRGEVRKSFAIPLNKALKSAGLKPFLDEEDMNAGDELPSKIYGAINNSKSAIVIFSENYPSSKWCLNELLLLLKRREESKTFFIIPILYIVNMNDIKHRFPKEVEHHKPKVDDPKIENWKEAFAKIKIIKAEHFSAKDFVKDFVQDIATMVKRKIQ